MRAPLFSTIAFVLLIAACGGNGDDGVGDDDGGATPIDGEPCVGLTCFQTDCPGGGTTSISGTVFMPNGTLPLYNVTVYVPAGPVGALAPGAQCDRCGTTLSGGALVQASTDTMGNFLLTDMPSTERMPAGSTIPLVIQVGKWRRQLELPVVGECIDTAIPSTETRLPRNQSEGDIPLMALTTGGADSLECLFRKIGIADTEFTTAGGAGRVHLYAGGYAPAGAGTLGTNKFDAANGAGGFAAATSLWGTAAEAPADITARLDDYDVVVLSCEGYDPTDAAGTDKVASSLAAMKAYADLGGRVFASHWHNYWLSDAAPDPWGAPILNFNFDGTNPPDPITATINTGFEKGMALSDWLAFVDTASTPGSIVLNEARGTLTSVDETKADKWIYLTSQESVQYTSFTTPLEAEPEDRCGRAVFSDIHVSTGDTSAPALAFPSQSCTTDVTTLTAQEKVLAFMLFDIASCVGPVVE